jgi:hypothetical protein
MYSPACPNRLQAHQPCTAMCCDSFFALWGAYSGTDSSLSPTSCQASGLCTIHHHPYCHLRQHPLLQPAPQCRPTTKPQPLINKAILPVTGLARYSAQAATLYPLVHSATAILPGLCNQAAMPATPQQQRSTNTAPQPSTAVLCCTAHHHQQQQPQAITHPPTLI